MAKKVIKLLLVIIWMFVIFSFSAQNGEKSQSVSDSVIVKTVEVVYKEPLTEQKKDQLVKDYSYIVRKIAHFTIFFVLAVLVMSLLKEYIEITPKLFIYTIIFCVIYACTDEIHQMFISERTPKLIDVLIDTSGSLLSSTILYKLYKSKILN